MRVGYTWRSTGRIGMLRGTDRHLGGANEDVEGSREGLVVNRVATVSGAVDVDVRSAGFGRWFPHEYAQSVRPASLATPLTAMFVDGEDGATVTGGHSYSFAAVTASHSGATLTFAVNKTVTASPSPSLPSMVRR